MAKAKKKKEEVVILPEDLERVETKQHNFQKKREEFNKKVKELLSTM